MKIKKKFNFKKNSVNEALSNNFNILTTFENKVT